MSYDNSHVQSSNRVGNIPMHWYDDMPHIGYDMNGKAVLRPAVGDELDKFLKTQEDPTAWYALDGHVATLLILSLQDVCPRQEHPSRKAAIPRRARPHSSTVSERKP